MTTKKQDCKEQGYHKFCDEKGQLIGFEIQHDNFEDASVVLTCQDCGMTCELQGDFVE